MTKRSSSFLLAIGAAALATALAVLPAGAMGSPQTEPPVQAETIPPGSYRSFSPFPILMFDSDIGFGYGGRVKFVDYLRNKESLDLILFNSTRGERWYVFTFSIPDLEI